MATREYPRNGLGFSEPHLGVLLDAALGLAGCMTTATETTILVTHPGLGPQHDAGVAAVLASYVLDPDFGMAVERRALVGAVATLRTWAADADTAAAQLGAAVDNWSGTTYSASKDAVLKQTLQGLQTLTTRLGRLCDRLADALTVQGL